jgi:hypothetical protein
MGGNSGGGKTITVTHPDYVQEHHDSFLNQVEIQQAIGLETNPFADFAYRNIDAYYFGIGYLISSYTSLYDMFGKFMAGLDLEELWKSGALSLLTSEEIYTHVTEQKRKLDDKIDIETLPKFKQEMRELNAVASSSFVIGCAKIEAKRVKDYAVISLEATANIIPSVAEKFSGNLSWCKEIILSYSKIMKSYFTLRIDTDIKTYTFCAEATLWPFTILDYNRRALNSLGPQFLENETTDKQTWLQKNKELVGGVSILLWTVQGAYIGSSYPPYGTIIGAVVGFVIGVVLYLIQ